MNEQLKPFKTVEEIAKKHRLDVSFIEKQLKMGEKIEHEHTKNHTLARDIALQHLDEIPDYYIRLKKMETSAKKEHKKFKDVKEESTSDGSLNYEWDYPINPEKMRYCPKCRKDETREDCQYGTKYWDLFSLPSKLKEETKSGDEGLHDWFSKSKSSDGKKGWVQLGGKWAGKPCARQKGQTSTPKCGSSKMKRTLSKDEEEAARSRKNRLDPNQPEKTGGARPTNVRTEEMDLQEVKDKPGKGSGKKDACYHKVKSRYDVWPSAYASGALVKCRRVGADNWGTKSEETMQEEERYCPLCDKRETRSECSYGGKTWDKVSVKDEEYSMARGELQTIANAVKRLQAKVGRGEGELESWVQSKITKAADYIDTAADYVASGEMEEQKLVDKIMDEMKCWPGYKKKGTQKLFGKKYNRCVKAEDVTIEDADGNTFAEVVDLIIPDPIKGFKSQVDEATRLQAQTGNVIAVTLMWRGKYYSLRMFFPQIKTPSRQEINDELQKVYPGSKVVHHSVSEFTSGEPIIQACGPQGGSSAKPGPSRAYVKPYGEQVEFDEDLSEGIPPNAYKVGDTIPDSATKPKPKPKIFGVDKTGLKGPQNPLATNEDWQSVNRKDRTAGLSKDAVAAYRRENPGSKLQTAVTEKNPEGKRAKRRASFCRRMKGMKSKLTSAKTARDPDSNINKALRRWNCN